MMMKRIVMELMTSNLASDVFFSAEKKGGTTQTTSTKG